jgi:hypothetical protein
MTSHAVMMRSHAAARELVARTAPAIAPPSVTGTSTVKSPPGSPSVMRVPSKADCTPASPIAGPFPSTRLPLPS